MTSFWPSELTGHVGCEDHHLLGKCQPPSLIQERLDIVNVAGRRGLFSLAHGTSPSEGPRLSCRAEGHSNQLARGPIPRQYKVSGRPRSCCMTLAADRLMVPVCLAALYGPTAEFVCSGPGGPADIERKKDPS